MGADEFRKLIEDATDPEKSKIALLDIQKAYEDAQTTIETLTAQQDENRRKINDLHTVNQQLFLRVTSGNTAGTSTDTQEEKPISEMSIEELNDKYRNIFNGGES